MYKKALWGLAATCVCLAISASPAHSAPNDVVLYATDVVQINGNWTRAADPIPANGQLLSLPDSGSTRPNPATNPTHYVEFTFTAQAMTPYRLWVRLRALNNSLS